MTCANPACRKEFQPKRRNQLFHSRDCREQAKRNRWAVVRVPKDRKASWAGRLLRQEAETSSATPLRCRKTPNPWFRYQKLILALFRAEARNTILRPRRRGKELTGSEL